MGWAARKSYFEASVARSLTYSRLHRPSGPCRENAQSAPVGRRTTMAGIFSPVIGLTKVNCLADHGLASSSTVAASADPAWLGSAGLGTAAAVAPCSATSVSETGARAGRGLLRPHHISSARITTAPAAAPPRSEE